MKNSQNSSPLNLIYDLVALQINLAYIYTGLHIFLWLFFMFDINVGAHIRIVLLQLDVDNLPSLQRLFLSFNEICRWVNSYMSFVFFINTNILQKSGVNIHIYYNMSVYHILVLILVVDINLYHILSTGTFLMIRLVYKENPQFLSLASAIRI